MRACVSSKPAYDGDVLTVTRDVAGATPTVRCHARGVLLAELLTRPLEPNAEPALVEAGAPVGHRPEIAWDNVNVGEPFPAWTWTPDAVENAEAAAQVEDGLACYRAGVLHPHAILGAANRAFTRRYVLPAWIHVGSVMRFRRLLRVGDEIEVRTVPTRKWRRKGHEFRGPRHRLYRERRCGYGDQTYVDLQDRHARRRERGPPLVRVATYATNAKAKPLRIRQHGLLPRYR